MNLNKVTNKIKSVTNRIDFDKHFNWFIFKFTLIDKSTQLNNNKINNLHPIRPRKGDVYLINFGRNIGNELSDIHMGIIVQSSLVNNFSSTVIVIPISSSTKLYAGHEKIIANDIQNGKLDKLPSKAKTEQIMFIDKSRLVHKVAEMTPEFVIRLEKRLLKTLDIKSE